MMTASSNNLTLQSEFSPPDLHGNVLWLDASDIDGDGITGGSFVDEITWVDKSSAGYGDASQSVSSRRPSIITNGLNNLSTISFNGQNFLDLDSSSFGMLQNVSGVSMFSVLKPMLDSPGQRVLMISTNESFKTRAGLSLFDDPSYDQEGSYLGGDGDFGVTGRVLDEDIFQRIEGSEVTIGKFHQYTGVIDYSQGKMSLFVDKLTSTTTNLLANPENTSNTLSANIRIGADAVTDSLLGTLRADLAELIVYNRVLDNIERESVENYLENKWKYNESEVELPTISDADPTSEQELSINSSFIFGIILIPLIVKLLSRKNH